MTENSGSTDARSFKIKAICATCNEEFLMDGCWVGEGSYEVAQVNVQPCPKCDSLGYRILDAMDSLWVLMKREIDAC